VPNERVTGETARTEGCAVPASTVVEVEKAGQETRGTWAGVAACLLSTAGGDAGLLVAAVQVSVDALKKGGRVDDRASVSAAGASCWPDAKQPPCWGVANQHRLEAPGQEPWRTASTPRVLAARQ